VFYEPVIVSYVPKKSFSFSLLGEMKEYNIISFKKIIRRRKI